MTRSPFSLWLSCGAGLALAVGLSARPAHACSPVAGGPSGAALSPVEGTRAGVGDAFLLMAERDPWLEGPEGERTPLSLVRRFERLQKGLGPSRALYGASAALLADQRYELHVSESASVHFFAQMETPRRSLDVAVQVALEQVPQSQLNGAGCYEGPLNGRPFTQIATVRLDYVPPAPLVLSVVGHDQSSGQNVEDSAFDGEPVPHAGAGMWLFFPLPEGVSHCFHVQVLDFAGTSLFNEPELCAEAGGTSRTFTAQVLDPAQPSPMSNDSPAGAPAPTETGPSGDSDMTAGSCSLSRPHRWPSPLVGAAFAALLVRRRRRRVCA
jgi:hypothetical protein